MTSALDRRGAFVYDAAVKTPVLVATTGSNITLSGVQTIDGVQVGNNGERVLVKNQTDASQNGIYAASTGTWVLATDSASNTDFVTGTIVPVALGTVNALTLWAVTCQDSPIVIGTSLLTFQSFASAAGAVQKVNNLSDLNNKQTAWDNLSIDGGTIASASSVNLDTATGSFVTISGTATINSITLSDGHRRIVRASGAFTLANGASLVLPGGANITAAAGDFMIFVGGAAGVVYCAGYFLASGQAVNVSGNVQGVFQFNGIVAPASLSSSQNNYAPSGIATANTLRLTSSVNVIITGLAASNISGQVMVIENANAAGGNTITLTSNDANSSAANRFGFIAPIVLTPGELVALTYDSTSSLWRLLGQPASPAPWGAFKNMLVKNSGGSPNSIISASADWLQLADTNNDTFPATSVNVTINSATSGAGGLDTGSLAASTAYFLWVIYNPTTNTVAGLMSTSATAPTMPSGYTFKMRVGWQFTDGSKNFLRITQQGRRAQYIVTPATNTATLPSAVTGVQGSVSVPTYVAVSLASLVPSTAIEVFLTCQMTLTNSEIIIAPNSNYGGIASTTNWPPFISEFITNSISSSLAAMMLEATSVSVAINAGGEISVFGWNDNI